MGFKKILVAMDRSPQAAVVFEQALELAQKEGSNLLVFHCLNWQPEGQAIPLIGTLGDVDMYGTLHRQHRERLQKEIEQVQAWLQDYYQQATAMNIPTEITHKIGEPGSQICNLAQNWGADLIVLGRRGHKGLSEIVLGSVSNYVIHHADCSVLVVQS